MTTLTFRSPVTKPILRAGTSKPVPPDPRAYDTFRVTQTFDNPDAFHRDGRKHNATDIGNFRCGDPVVAMHAGTVRRVRDNATAYGAKTDGLGIIQDCGHGIELVYWHLDGFTVAHGATVAAGQQIGIVGRTGLGDVCHLHIEAKRDGVKFDPEPLMFTGSITVEDDMDLPHGLRAVVVAALGVNNRLRIDPATPDGAKLMEETRDVQILGTGITGQSYTLGGKTGNEYTLIGVYGRAWYVAAPLLVNWRLKGDGETMIAPADCSALEDELRVVRTKLSRALTSATGSAQAANATVEALR